ncbi:transmembrane 7 superfamily member 3-like [Schistocerca cancellata]|uniref:transmembrane 7 superfamily member 3-like n=1 Tax=Schistocerca cancellata TaxID=274614 RepID=UPI0021194152|nr:transmembrane 7 superfamily member 3-like [Schistocerca cancellata]
MSYLMLIQCMKSKRNSLLILSVLFCSVFLPVSVQTTDINTFVEDGDTINLSLLNYNILASPGAIVDQFIDIAPSSIIAVNVTNIPSDGGFLLLQTHAYQYEIVLSYNKVLTPHTYVNGSNIGLIREIKGQLPAQFFVHNTNPVRNITIMVAAQAYADEAPIPGGCNMEFSVEIAPYLRITETEAVIIVDGQPPGVSTLPSSCEFSPPSEVLMYHMYLPEMDFSRETYFRALRAMMTVQGIKDHGLVIEPSLIGSSLRRTYNAYRGTGTVYGAIATSGFSGSAYVPAITYGCSGEIAIDSCEVLHTVFSKVLCATAFFLGIFQCFFGHRFFRTGLFLAGFLSGGIVTYIILTLQNSLSTPVLETVSVILGMLFGIVWLLLWRCCGVPLISILLPSMTFGFLIASTSMYATLADIPVLRSDTNFWAAFVCIMLLVVLVVLLCPPLMSKSNIISCAVLGAYATIIPIDYYIGSNLKYVLVNTIRRATVSGYNAAVINPPFQFRDIILVAVWISLTVLGSCAQIWQQKGKPPFPPPPYRSRYGRLIDRTLSSQTPLMIDARIPYGTVPETPASAEQRFTFLPKMPRISLPIGKL